MVIDKHGVTTEQALRLIKHNGDLIEVDYERPTSKVPEKIICYKEGLVTDMFERNQGDESYKCTKVQSDMTMLMFEVKMIKEVT